MANGALWTPTDLGWWVYPLLYGNNGSWSTLAHLLVLGSVIFQRHQHHRSTSLGFGVFHHDMFFVMFFVTFFVDDQKNQTPLRWNGQFFLLGKEFIKQNNSYPFLSTPVINFCWHPYVSSYLSNMFFCIYPSLKNHQIYLVWNIICFSIPCWVWAHISFYQVGTLLRRWCSFTFP